jgi:hypothetical protein
VENLFVRIRPDVEDVDVVTTVAASVMSDHLNGIIGAFRVSVKDCL